MAGAAQMSMMSWAGLVLALVLCIYLFVALLVPEKFQ
jgi:K+-transporting ATPase KdpF subunit